MISRTSSTSVNGVMLIVDITSSSSACRLRRPRLRRSHHEVTNPTSSAPASRAASRMRMIMPYGALASAMIETCMLSAAARRRRPCRRRRGPRRVRLPSTKMTPLSLTSTSIVLFLRSCCVCGELLLLSGSSFWNPGGVIERGQDHEDDEQDQQHVGERRDVDLRHHLVVCRMTWSWTWSDYAHGLSAGRGRSGSARRCCGSAASRPAGWPRRSSLGCTP